MNKVNATVTDEATILSTLQSAKEAMAAGRVREADELLTRIAQLAPGHPAVLNELGLRMMLAGEPAKARDLFVRATQAEPRVAQLWSNLASSLNALDLIPEELEAVERALTLEPRHTAALLQKGMVIERRGDLRNAARMYRNAIATLQPGAPPPETLRGVLARAREVITADDVALSGAIEERLAPIRARHGGGAQRRLERCIDLLTGKRTYFEPRPTFMHFPELPALDFYERGDFPWLDTIEAASDEIRAELLSVLVADRAGLEPYIAYPDGTPLNQWRELNKSRRWSAYFLWNQGVPQPAHLARCPRTAEAVKAAPQCEVANRAPTVYFSILEPGTRIPPHTGVTNTRLIVHLPLIIPPDCGFRVGSETRQWVPGKAWVFDDTIEHEAWNLSDAPRAILIFDIWNPFLCAAERDMVRAATEVIGSYYGNTAQETA